MILLDNLCEKCGNTSPKECIQIRTGLHNKFNRQHHQFEFIFLPFLTLIAESSSQTIHPPTFY
jgi:hypothetical protein